MFKAQTHKMWSKLLTAIKEAGYLSQTDFARAAGVDLTALNPLLTGKVSPLNASGEFSSAAKTVMEVLGCCPSDLWTEDQIIGGLSQKDQSRFHVQLEAMKMDAEDASCLPDPYDDLESRQYKEAILDVVATLTKQERSMVVLNFGLMGGPELNQDEIGVIFDYTRSRIGQILAKALRKLKHPDRALRIWQLEEPELHQDRLKRETLKAVESEAVPYGFAHKDDVWSATIRQNDRFTEAAQHTQALPLWLYLKQARERRELAQRQESECQFL